MTIKELYGELFILMTHCACGDMDYVSSTECAEKFQNMLDCLKKHANVEEDLGIDLATLSKALKNGIWFIETHGCISGPYKPLIAKEGPVLSLDYEFQYELNFNDYGKKEPMGWALTKEELL